VHPDRSTSLFARSLAITITATLCHIRNQKRLVRIGEQFSLSFSQLTASPLGRGRIEKRSACTHSSANKNEEGEIISNRLFFDSPMYIQTGHSAEYIKPRLYTHARTASIATRKLLSPSL
jgi:hypothetical protein